jgi:hypothetical protein
MIELIVARYDEDLRWIERLDTQTTTVMVYNKGNTPLPYSPYYRSTHLPNIGREGQTYVHAILSYYTYDIPYFAFVQGHPFDHVREDALFQALQTQRADRMLPLTEHIFHDNGTAQHHTHRLPIHEYYEQLTGRSRKTEYLFYVGCQFLVASDVIRQHTYEWWYRIYRLFDTEPMFPWIFERLIPSILIDV